MSRAVHGPGEKLRFDEDQLVGQSSLKGQTKEHSPMLGRAGDFTPGAIPCSSEG